MFIKREIFGSIVTLVFYIGIMTTVFSFTTGVIDENVAAQGIESSAKKVSLNAGGESLYGYEQY